LGEVGDTISRADREGSRKIIKQINLKDHI